MLDSLKRDWEGLQKGSPGSRFQEQFKRRRESGQGAWKRWLYIGGGIAFLVAGLFFLPAPGPGSLILVAGAALLAQGSLTAARATDWLELRIRSLWEWLRGVWNRSSVPVRALLILAAAALAAGAVYGAYWILFAG